MRVVLCLSVFHRVFICTKIYCFKIKFLRVSNKTSTCLMIELYEHSSNDYHSRKSAMCVLVHCDKIRCSDPAIYCRTKYRRYQPSHSLIHLWHKKFTEAGTAFDAGKSGRPRTSEENIKRVRQTFHRSMNFVHC